MFSTADGICSCGKKHWIEAPRSQPCQIKWRSWLPVARHAGRLRLFCSQDMAGNDWRLQRSHQKIHQIQKCKNLYCLLDTFWWWDNQTHPFGGRDSVRQCNRPEIMLEFFLWPFLSIQVHISPILVHTRTVTLSVCINFHLKNMTKLAPCQHGQREWTEWAWPALSTQAPAPGKGRTCKTLSWGFLKVGDLLFIIINIINILMKIYDQGA